MSHRTFIGCSIDTNIPIQVSTAQAVQFLDEFQWD